MAPLADVRPDELPQVIRRMEARIVQEAVPGEAATLWTATYLLMGLRYPPELATQLLQGVRGMKESTTYQAILAEGEEQGLEKGREEGRLAEARSILMRLGARRFGPPSAGTRAAIEQIASVERLEALTERVLDVESWEDLLAG